jgi:hypothetical protein
MLALIGNLLAGSSMAMAFESDWTATIYTGRLADNSWHQIVFSPSEVKYKDSYLVCGALSRTFARFLEGALRFEVEGQVVKHWGQQDHWEFNLPVGGRWYRFPWNRWVETTAAFAVGPSYATELPRAEVELKEDSQQLLAYWFMELTVGPPKAFWTVNLRLHHRSTAFGLFATEGTGGSNFLSAGLKLAF